MMSMMVIMMVMMMMMAMNYHNEDDNGNVDSHLKFCITYYLLRGLYTAQLWYSIIIQSIPWYHNRIDTVVS